MPGTLLLRLRFLLERWVQRGVLAQLAFVVGLVALVALLGGIAAWRLTDAFASLPEAVWWSFLRLTDPGYLGDDEGTASRAVSTIVTVLGYILFLGLLIAILTQWMNEWVERGDVALDRLIAHVLVHEIAHHFGYSDDDIAAIDDWRL